MTNDEFRLLLDARGPELSGWPASDRAAAEGLLARSAEARAALQEARALDGLLARTLGRGGAGRALRGAVLRIPELHPQVPRRPAAFVWAWRAGLAAAAASVLLGIVAGWSGVAPPLEEPEPIDLAALVYARSFDEETLP